MSKNPAKVCVFCGEKPESKTKEHILPQWLIELTGDPKRIINVGGFENPKRFSINSFHFPACDDCNNAFGELEGKTKAIIQKLFNDDYVTGDDCEILLDWFDKIRIGMWLASLNLHGNQLGITPKFHIATRIAMHDRLLYIGRTSITNKKLHFNEIDEWFFQCLPGVFVLRVNSFWFITVSGVGISAGSLGLPYVKSEGECKNGISLCTMKTEIKPGWRLNWPTAPMNFTLLAQAIYQEPLMPEDGTEILHKELNKKQYEDILQESKDRSFVYMLQNSKLTKIADTPTKITPYIYDNNKDIHDKIAQTVEKLRRYLAKRIFIPKDERKTDFGNMIRYVKKTGKLAPILSSDKLKER